MTSPSVRLDTIALSIEAYRRLWSHWAHALRLGLPVLALGVAWNIWIGSEISAPLAPAGTAPDMATSQQMMDAQMAVLGPMLLYLVPAALLYGILIGNLSRLLLIGPEATYPMLGLALDARLRAVVWRFVLSLFAMLAVIFLAAIPLSLVLGFVGAAGGGLAMIAVMATLLVVMAIWLRLSVAAYATALDRPMSLTDAWRLTTGNALPLLGAWLAVNLPVVAASLIVGTVLGTIFKSVPYSATLIIGLIALVASLVSVSVVALAVGQLLGGPAGRPMTHPQSGI